MGNERLPVDEEAIVVREKGDLDVVARERADRVLRLPEAHRHELGAVPLVAPEDVVTQIPGSRPSSTATGLLDVLEIRVGVLALGPAAPRAGNHMSFNASPRRCISHERDVEAWLQRGLLRGMLSLDSPRWGELRTAYGPAGDVPELLRQLESLPDSEESLDEPWFSIWSALAHQGDVYSASFAAVPHVVSVLASAPERAGFQYFQFPAWVEICRQRTGEPVPEDLRGGYQSALAELPALAAASAARPWDEATLVSVLSAIAATKGPVDIAEAVLELTSEVASEFLAWFADR